MAKPANGTSTKSASADSRTDNRQSPTRGYSQSSSGYSQDPHRTPPNSAEAEQGVLGSMLISPKDVIPICVEKLTAEHFYTPAHSSIFTVLVEMWDEGKAVDLITFTQVLRDRDLLEVLGGPSLITHL
jgi:hypothetical protein